MPLARASCRNWREMSLSRSNGSVVVSTNCTGRPMLPGKGGGWNAATRTPAMPLICCCTTGCRSFAVLVRWSQGLSTMPEIDWPGTSSWKTCSVSGWAAKIL